MIDHEAHIDAQLDHLVDTRQMSYTEAYEHLGIEVPSEDLSASALHEATGNVALTGAETFIQENDWTTGLKGADLARAVLQGTVTPPEQEEPSAAQVAADHAAIDSKEGQITDWDTLQTDPKFKPRGV